MTAYEDCSRLEDEDKSKFPAELAKTEVTGWMRRVKWVEHFKDCGISHARLVANNGLPEVGDELLGSVCRRKLMIWYGVATVGSCSSPAEEGAIRASELSIDHHIRLLDQLVHGNMGFQSFWSLVSNHEIRSVFIGALILARAFVVAAKADFTTTVGRFSHYY